MRKNHRTVVTLAALIIGKQASITAAAYTAGFTGTKTNKKPHCYNCSRYKTKTTLLHFTSFFEPKTLYISHKNCISDTLLALAWDIIAFC